MSGGGPCEDELTAQTATIKHVGLEMCGFSQVLPSEAREQGFLWILTNKDSRWLLGLNFPRDLLFLPVLFSVGREGEMLHCQHCAVFY